METLRIPAFKPGRYRVICHLTGKPKWVEYTAADVQSVIRNGNAQLSAGLACPMTWMHDLSARPDKHNPQKWMAKEFFGHPSGWRFDAEAVAVAPVDAADAKRAEKIRWVSPSVVYDYVDQLGRKWPGASVLHIASTPQPVQIGLTPVSSFSAYRETLLSTATTGAVWLSYETGVTRMDNEEVIAEGTAPGEAVAGAADVAAAPDDGLAALNNIIGLFARFGVEVPEGDFATMADLEAAVTAAVDAAVAGKGTDDMGAMGKPKPDHAAAVMPPVLMSMPTVPSHANFIVREAASQEKGLRDRIADLARSGRISVKKRDEALAELTRQDLSVEPHRFFDANFEFRPPPLAAKVAAWEELEPGKFAADNMAARTQQATHLSITRPTVGVPPPGGAGAEARNPMIETMAKRNGIPYEDAERMMAGKYSAPPAM